MINMVDLPAAHARLEPQLSEAIGRVVSSGVYIRGHEVEALESELAQYTGSAHALTCANGTEALQIALMALGLQRGDEVILPSYSFIATAEVCALLGLTPVFADIDPKSFNIATSEIENLITPRTKAIVPVHLFGRPAEMERIMQIANRHKLFVVEDGAQAFGAECVVDGKRKKVCSIGHIGCTSFFPTKNLGCLGDGGAVFTNDEALAKRMKTIASHGAERKYHSTMVGLNSRLDAIQATVLRLKLRHLDEYISRRQWAALKYRELLHGNDFVTCPENTDGHTFNQFTLRVNYGCRDDLRNYLRNREVATMIYFPEPIHRQPVFAHYNDVSLPESDRASAEVLNLPMHSELTIEDISTICNLLNQWEIGKK